MHLHTPRSSFSTTAHLSKVRERVRWEAQGLTQPGAGLFSHGWSLMLFIEVAAILPPFLPAFAAALTIAPTLVSVCESFWLKMLLLNAGMNWLGSAWATNNNEIIVQHVAFSGSRNFAFWWPYKFRRCAVLNLICVCVRDGEGSWPLHSTYACRCVQIPPPRPPPKVWTSLSVTEIRC